MLEVNFLPWREDAYKRKNQCMIGMLAIIISMSVFACSLMHVVMSRELRMMHNKNEKYKIQLHELDEKIPHDNTLKIQEMVGRIRQHQVQWRRLSRVLSVSSGITWRMIKSKDGQITMHGDTGKLGSLFFFMRNDSVMQYLDAWIKSIKINPKSGLVEFQIQMHGAEVNV